MIQRIQTLFLLASLAFTALLLFLSLGSITTSGVGESLFMSKGLALPETGEIIFPTVPLFILAIAICLLTTISIFLYKNRNLQMRLTIYNIILMIGFVGLSLFYIYAIKNNSELQYLSHSLKATFIFPVASAILSYLAFRNIRKDELLIKSYDRLR